jgi:hypothetical protein
MTKTSDNDEPKDEAAEEAAPAPEPRLGPDGKPMAPEYGGPKGHEPTRHGEWEINGRVSDF